MMKKSPQSHSLSLLRETKFPPFSLLLLALIFSAAIFYTSNFSYISGHYLSYSDDDDLVILPAATPTEKREILVPRDECDVYSGRWVRDYHSRPLYEEWECPYIGDQFTCLKHGRKEKDYLYWRWQPHACSLPSFNATLMLEGLRGKRLMFVGDSTNRGQFRSLVCLLHRNIPQDAKSIEAIDSSIIFTAKEYDARIEYYWAPFLLESNSDDPNKHRVKDRIIRNSGVDKHGQHWKEADIIVFNTYLWWVEGIRLLQGSFEDEVKQIVEISIEDGYRLAMKMLVKWINDNIDPKRKRVFFVGLSATHQASKRWPGGGPIGNCYNETTMIEDPTFIAANTTFLPIIVEELSKSSVPITFLNITQLTSPRKDGHTSIYKAFFDGPLTEKQLANASRYADCIHWCLPGVQDTWNELLYSNLFYPSLLI